MNTRKGAALVMALVVALVGSIIMGIIFNVTFRQAWFAPRETAIFVDHTTMVDLIQAEMARIIQTNDQSPDGNIVLFSNTLAGMRANPTAPGNANSINNLQQLAVDSDVFNNFFERSVAIADGVGQHLTAQITVFDIAFNPDWLDMGVGGIMDDPDELPPPSFFVPNPANVFGAYMIRVELLDNDGNRMRMAEKAFVQTLN